MSAHREDYQGRINRVMDYIDQHLSESLDLDTLAAEANFSRFHFHRIFRAMVGEAVNQYVQRVKIEKAATLLIHQPKSSITEIALQCGFSSSATFARAFKDAFEMSASEWRNGGNTAHSKNRKTDSKTGQQEGKDGKATRYKVAYLGGVFSNHLQWNIMKNQVEIAKVEIKELPAMEIAYVRHVGPYNGRSELFAGMMNQLIQWGAPRGLVNFPQTQMLSVYHDDPAITDEAQLRLTVGMSVPADTKAEGEIGRMATPAGKYAVAHFEIDGDAYEEAWSAVYQQWLPDSGYQPADGPSLELYLNNPETHPEKKHIVEICVPVKPM
ncbi:MAG: AraC family transcriptional regulator [Bacteroidota bacterium]